MGHLGNSLIELVAETPIGHAHHRVLWLISSSLFLVDPYIVDLHIFCDFVILRASLLVWLIEAADLVIQANEEFISRLGKGPVCIIWRHAVYHVPIIVEFDRPILLIQDTVGMEGSLCIADNIPIENVLVLV